MKDNKTKAIYSIVDQIIYSAANFIGAIVLARLLTPEEFGIYVLLFSIWLFVFFIQKGLINDSLYVLTHAEGEGFKASLFTVQVLYSTSVLFICFILLLSIDPDEFLMGAIDYLIFSFALALLSLREYVRNHNLASLNVVTTMNYDALYFILFCSLLFVEWIFVGVTLSIFWLDVIFSAFVVLIIDIKRSRLKLVENVEELKNIMKVNHSFSKWNVMINIYTWGFSNSFKYVVYVFLGPGVVGAVGACQYIMHLSNPIITGLQNYSISLLSKNSSNDDVFKRMFIKSQIGIMVVVLSMSIPLLLLPGYLLKIFYEDKYLGYEMLLVFFGFNLIITNIGRIFHIKMLVRQRTKELHKVYMYAFPLSLAIMIPSLGMFGLNGFKFYLIASSLIFTYLVYLKALKQK